MSWIESELNKIEEERRKRFGGLEIYQFGAGEHVLTFILKEEPKELRTRYGMRKAFLVEKDGKDYMFLLNPMSPLYRQLLQLFKRFQGRTIVKVRIVKAGQGRNTTYTLSTVE
ncbi:MAG: hypothetical protein QXS37_06770 [Candidatus Aenigmatarchaeota archaeon]